MDSKPASPRNTSAFTLPEMLTVIAIIAMLAGLAGMAMKGVMQSQRLDEAGRVVVGKINRARQIASARNENVQVRFIKKVRPDSGSTTALFWQVQAGIVKSGTFTPVTEMTSLPQGMVISPSATLSPLLASIASGTSTNPAYEYIPVGISPSGQADPPSGLSLSEPVKWAVTLVPETSQMANEVDEVKDFITIQIDPLTTRTRTFRP